MIKTLDTVIAMVIVLLVLSLIVQSLQTIVKKWFKFKSRTILDSLHDLFTYVQEKEDQVKEAAQASDKLVEAVKGELKKLGRVSLISKHAMVDSIAKEDLLKILERIGATNLQGEVDKWYETVMQGFEERYTRHMKTVAICISVVVVIFFNANFFQVYQNISKSDQLRTALIAQSEDVNKRLDALREQGAQASGTAQQQLEAAQKQLAADIDNVASLGFTPLRREQVSAFFSGQIAPMHALKVLIGWAIMVMLLSVGAPFWQDVLESLFGVKNILRAKSGTKNVEDQAGEGQPKV
jgi:predicted lactoylglutathione lyase